jgi:hypothetical protein
LPASFLMNDQKKVTLNLASSTETVPTQNVVAVWEGSDPVLKAEYVAVGAHYDHVGSGCRARLRRSYLQRRGRRRLGNDGVAQHG